MATITITAAGKRRTIVRRIGVQGWYYEEAPSPSAPHGAWWLAHPQHGFVAVPSNGRALLAARREAGDAV